jgi:tRNA A-37 threonylcarbamoyl transferase component Bud32
VFPDFIHLTRDQASIWIDRCLADGAFIEGLADADQLFREASCQVIKDQRKIKVGRLTLKVAGAPRSIYIKRYNVFSLRYRLASPFIRSGAFRALQGAAILRAANISTAIPIAAVENRVRRTLTKSFFITYEIARGKPVDDYWREELGSLNGNDGVGLRRAFLKSLAQLFHNLHWQGVYHNDLKDANILAVRKEPNGAVGFFLLDLEGVKRYTPLSEKRRIKNLVQLHRTLGRTLRRTDKLIFLKHYLGAAFSGRETRRRLIDKLLRESNRLDVIKVRSVRDRVAEKKASHA